MRLRFFAFLLLIFGYSFCALAADKTSDFDLTTRATLEQLSEELRMEGSEKPLKSIELRQEGLRIERGDKIYPYKKAKKTQELQKERLNPKFQLGITTSWLMLYGLETRYWLTETFGLQIYQNVLTKSMSIFEETTGDYHSDAWTLLEGIYKIAGDENYRFSLFGGTNILSATAGRTILYGGMVEFFNDYGYTIIKFGRFPFYLSFGAGVTVF